MKRPSAHLAALTLATATCGFFISAHGTELVPHNEFATPGDFTQNFRVSAGFGFSIEHSDDDDGGIGLGGFVHLPPDIGSNVSIVYDTDGSAGTQVFDDVTVAVDHRVAASGASVGFVVRGNASRGDGIRVLLTNRNRLRVWTGVGLATNQDGVLQYDQTATAARTDWSHLRLDVRNVGDQVELAFRVYDSQVRFDESTLVAEHIVTLSAADSAPYLNAGEIGLRIEGLRTSIDNFAVYEYGTAPAALPHPELDDFFPAAGTEYHQAENGFSFHARSFAGIDPADISLVLNGMDVTSGLDISGDPEDRAVHYPGLDTDLDYVAEIEVTALSGEITTRRFEFSTTLPPDPEPLIDLIEFAEESDVTGNFTAVVGGLTFIESWDGGIGLGGFMRGSGTGNFIYDTDGQPGTQVFGDFSATMDHRLGGSPSSLTFIVRANRATDQAIRVTLTNRNRMRVWTGSSISSGTAGPLVFDESMPSGLSVEEWVHMRLDVRNVGEGFDTEIEIRLRAFGSQTDLAMPAFDMTCRIPSFESSAHLDAGEVGIRTGSGNHDIDNFGIYAYGTAPVWRPHPEIRNISPEPGTQGIEEPVTLSFEVTGTRPNPSEGIALFINGNDVTNSLVFDGDESRWLISYDNLMPPADIHIEAANAEAVSTAFFSLEGPAPEPPTDLDTLYVASDFDDLLFPGEAGGGWANPWQHAASVQPEIHTADPIDNGTSYLHVDVAPGQTPSTRNVARRYQSFGDFDISQPHVIHWKFRVPLEQAQFETTFTGSNDSVHFFGRSAARLTNRQDGSSAWHIVASGAAINGVTAGKTFWVFDNVDGSGGFSTTNNVDTGIEMIAGHVYSFAVTIFPDTRTYMVAIEDETGGATFESEFPHRFRSSQIDPPPFTWLHFGVQASPSSQDFPFDLDSVYIFGPAALPHAGIRGLIHSGTAVGFEVQTIAGFEHVVEFTDDLQSGEWDVLTTLTGNDDWQAVTDSNPHPDRRFYRVSTVPQN